MIVRPDFHRLDQALAGWPRQQLSHTPTPLDFLPGFSADYPGHNIYLKRDDCTGLAMGGNKARQLEFYLGDAMDRDSDVVLSTGAVQSNYMRSLAAAAAKLGLECHIQLESRVDMEDEDYQQSGNVLLDRLFGAHIHHYSEGEDEQGADQNLHVIAGQLKAEGRRPYIVPLAPVEQPRGALGYVLAARELVSQFVEQSLLPDRIVVASGSGLTHAGLVVGLALLDVDIQVLGACVRRPANAQHQRVLETCRKVEKMLGHSGLVPDHAVMLSDIALAPGYGQQSQAVINGIHRMARREGILLDPVYSGKTCTTLMLLLEQDELAEARNIVMIHTGGTPALFAYRRRLSEAPAIQ